MAPASRPQGHVYGWVAIAATLERSVRWCQGQADRNRDPLPVRVGHRGVYADVEALRAWADRQDMSYTTHRELSKLRACANLQLTSESAEE